jgi:hypothetical protein
MSLSGVGRGCASSPLGGWCISVGVGLLPFERAMAVALAGAREEGAFKRRSRRQGFSMPCESFWLRRRDGREKVAAMFEPGLPSQSITGALTLFLALAIGHAFADFPLQGDYMATHKNRNHQAASRAALPRGLWIHCMLAHSLIHAGFVWAISGQVVLAVTELIIHFALDFGKCEGWTSFNVDQGLHYVCKAGYVIVLYQGWLA